MVFFVNDTATTEIYTLSLHDALPISVTEVLHPGATMALAWSPNRAGNWIFHCHFVGHISHHLVSLGTEKGTPDRKSTRLNSSHANISYAVFCLKKKRFLIADHDKLLI